MNYLIKILEDPCPCVKMTVLYNHVLYKSTVLRINRLAVKFCNIPILYKHFILREAVK